jgi:hypothetical protein
MRWALILIASAVAAIGQIDNPPSSVNITDATATGRAVLTATNAAAARSAIGLGATNDVTFLTLTVPLGVATVSGLDGTFVVPEGVEFNGVAAANTRTNLGLGATNSPTFSNLTLSGTLTAASIATSTPVSWSLDAVQTAAATNGVLDLPLNANVLRITNANTISAITNGRLGAFYYIVNQSGTNLVLSNSSTLTTRGGGTVTLAPNQSATLLSTSATNATLQGGPSQLDSPTFAGLTTSGTLTATGNITMSGTANTAPNQTAASGSSLMTRDLSDARYGGRTVLYLTNFVSVTNSTTPVDTPLSVALPVGNYLVRSALFAENAAAAPGHAFLFDFTGVASPQRLFGQIGSLSTGGIRLDFPLTVTRSVSNSFIAVVNVEGYLKITTTGTLTLKYAQQTATTNVSQLKEGFLEVIKLP